MTLIEKIFSDPQAYSLNVETLGECKIESPIRNREFIDTEERILITENVKKLKYVTDRLGTPPSFERAGPHQKIFHDPTWSRVGILTAGGLCPGLNHVIKGLVEILMFDYGIKTIYGIRYGYAGLIPRYGYQPIMLNTDTVVAPHSLLALLRRLDERPSAGAVGSTLVYYWRPERVQARGGAVFHPWTGGSQHLGVDSLLSDLPQDPGPTEQACSYIVGASMLITQDWLARVGPMCEDYFLYYEEIDWAERGRLQGFELAWAPDSLVFHKVGGSSRKRASRLSLRYLYRNRLVFTRRFHPGMRGRVVRAMGRQLVHHALRGHWDDVRELMGAIWAFRREWLVL